MEVDDSRITFDPALPCKSFHGLLYGTGSDIRMPPMPDRAPTEHPGLAHHPYSLEVNHGRFTNPDSHTAVDYGCRQRRHHHRGRWMDRVLPHHRRAHDALLRGGNLSVPVARLRRLRHRLHPARELDIPRLLGTGRDPGGISADQFRH